jgi:hypothetical protein
MLNTIPFGKTVWSETHSPSIFMVDPTFRLGPLAETLFCPRDRRVDRVGCWYAEAPVASAKTTAAVETFIVKFQTVKFGILHSSAAILHTSTKGAPWATTIHDEFSYARKNSDLLHCIRQL